jgi:hypothetical protein
MPPLDLIHGKLLVLLGEMEKKDLSKISKSLQVQGKKTKYNLKCY